MEGGLLLIGPEGDFTPVELKTLLEAGAVPVSFVCVSFAGVEGADMRPCDFLETRTRRVAGGTGPAAFASRDGGHRVAFDPHDVRRRREEVNAPTRAVSDNSVCIYKFICTWCWCEDSSVSLLRASAIFVGGEPRESNLQVGQHQPAAAMHTLTLSAPSPWNHPPPASSTYRWGWGVGRT